MTTESKKLQTHMDGPYLLGTNDAGLYAAYEHDARIAHEQREAMRRMVGILKGRFASEFNMGVIPLYVSELIDITEPFLED